jgi:hypothetical protein
MRTDDNYASRGLLSPEASKILRLEKRLGESYCGHFPVVWSTDDDCDRSGDGAASQGGHNWPYVDRLEARNSDYGRVSF